MLGSDIIEKKVPLRGKVETLREEMCITLFRLQSTFGILGSTRRLGESGALQVGPGSPTASNVSSLPGEAWDSPPCGKMLSRLTLET